ncbi:MAG: TIGR00730 family Rossman fold protein [Bacteroidales bacterium]|nr:TIGR00730 family Rossman fold protein [Bacteroidales bacterium]
MRIGVYCSANPNIDPEFICATKELGRWIGEKGHSLVWGGCSLGLMNIIGEEAKRAGARCIGVLPRKIEERGRIFHNLDICIPCHTLSDRKDLLVANSDITIALPGGIGTLDEVMTQCAATTVGYHSKPVILFNINGFWDPLISLLNHFEKENLMRGNYRDRIKTATSIAEIEAIIETYLHP